MHENCANVNLCILVGFSSSIPCLITFKNYTWMYVNTVKPIQYWICICLSISFIEDMLFYYQRLVFPSMPSLFKVHHFPFLIPIVCYQTSSSNGIFPSDNKHGDTSVVKCVAVKVNLPEFELWLSHLLLWTIHLTFLSLSFLRFEIQLIIV